MALTYRTSTYGGADTPLTNLQVDENFSWLNANKTYLRLKGGSAGTLVSGDVNLLAGTNVSIVQSGNDITISANDSSVSVGDINATGTLSSSTFLRGDGAWSTIDSFPSQTGNTGKYLTTNGSVVSWATVDALPSQTGNTGKYLTTNGTAASWATLNTSVPISNFGVGQAGGDYPLVFTTSNVSISGSLTQTYTDVAELTFTADTGTLNATSFNSLSDVRYKTDLNQIKDALAKVKELTGYTFKLMESNTPGAGLIAQDVDKVLPEAIGGSEERMSVAYGAIMGLIVEAIKELSDKVDNIQNNLSNK